VDVAGYNGLFQITGVPTPTSFTYTAASGSMDASGGGSASTGASESNTTVTVTTGSTPHNYVAGQTVTIANVGLAGYNGLFQIVSVPTPTSFTYTAASGLTASGGGTASTGASESNTTVTVTTGSTQHGYAIGQTVTISGWASRVTTVRSRSPGSRPDEFHLRGRVRIDGFGRR